MIERWFEPFTLLTGSVSPDGQTNQAFIPFLSFRGALSMIPASQSIEAGQPFHAAALVLLHEFDVTLAAEDLVRREKTGMLYRVTDRAESMRNPAFSGLQFAQVPVERWTHPN